MSEQESDQTNYGRNLKKWGKDRYTNYFTIKLRYLSSTDKKNRMQVLITEMLASYGLISRALSSTPRVLRFFNTKALVTQSWCSFRNWVCGLKRVAGTAEQLSLWSSDHCEGDTVRQLHTQLQLCSLGINIICLKFKISADSDENHRSFNSSSSSNGKNTEKDFVHTTLCHL